MQHAYRQNNCQTAVERQLINSQPGGLNVILSSRILPSSEDRPYIVRAPTERLGIEPLLL
jgi:hypothetical protein